MADRRWDRFFTEEYRQKTPPEMLMDFNTFMMLDPTYKHMSPQNRSKVKQMIFGALGYPKIGDIVIPGTELNRKYFQGLDPKIQERVFDSLFGDLNVETPKLNMMKAQFLPGWQERETQKLVQKQYEQMAKEEEPQAPMPGAPFAPTPGPTVAGPRPQMQPPPIPGPQRVELAPPPQMAIPPNEWEAFMAGATPTPIGTPATPLPSIAPGGKRLIPYQPPEPEVEKPPHPPYLEALARVAHKDAEGNYFIDIPDPKKKGKMVRVPMRNEVLDFTDKAAVQEAMGKTPEGKRWLKYMDRLEATLATTPDVEYQGGAFAEWVWDPWTLGVGDAASIAPGAMGLWNKLNAEALEYQLEDALKNPESRFSKPYLREMLKHYDEDATEEDLDAAVKFRQSQIAKYQAKADEWFEKASNFRTLATEGMGLEQQRILKASTPIEVLKGLSQGFFRAAPLTASTVIPGALGSAVLGSAFIGAIGTGAALEMSMVATDLWEEYGDEFDGRSAVGWGTAAGVLEGLGAGHIAKYLVGNGVSRRTISKAFIKAGKGIAKKLPDMIKAGNWEGVTEFAQTFIEELALAVQEDTGWDLDRTKQFIYENGGQAFEAGIIGWMTGLVPVAGGQAYTKMKGGDPFIQITQEEIDEMVWNVRDPRTAVMLDPKARARQQVDALNVIVGEREQLAAKARMERLAQEAERASVADRLAAEEDKMVGRYLVKAGHQEILDQLSPEERAAVIRRTKEIAQEKYNELVSRPTRKGRPPTEKQQSQLLKDAFREALNEIQGAPQKAPAEPAVVEPEEEEEGPRIIIPEEYREREPQEVIKPEEATRGEPTEVIEPGPPPAPGRLGAPPILGPTGEPAVTAEEREVGREMERRAEEPPGRQPRLILPEDLEREAPPREEAAPEVPEEAPEVSRAEEIADVAEQLKRARISLTKLTTNLKGLRGKKRAAHKLRVQDAQERVRSLERELKFLTQEGMAVDVVPVPTAEPAPEEEAETEVEDIEAAPESDEEASDEMTDKIEAGKPGQCYSNVWNYLNDHVINGPSETDFTVVHGKVTNVEGKTFDHAWLETADHVTDPTTGVRMEKDRYYKLLDAKPDAEYSAVQAYGNMARAKHHGPWTVDEIGEGRSLWRREEETIGEGEAEGEAAEEILIEPTTDEKAFNASYLVPGEDRYHTLTNKTGKPRRFRTELAARSAANKARAAAMKERAQKPDGKLSKAVADELIAAAEEPQTAGYRLTPPQWKLAQNAIGKGKPTFALAKGWVTADHIQETQDEYGITDDRYAIVKVEPQKSGKPLLTPVRTDLGFHDASRLLENALAGKSIEKTPGKKGKKPAAKKKAAAPAAPEAAQPLEADRALVEKIAPAWLKKDPKILDSWLKNQDDDAAIEAALPNVDRAWRYDYRKPLNKLRNDLSPEQAAATAAREHFVDSVIEKLSPSAKATSYIQQIARAFYENDTTNIDRLFHSLFVVAEPELFKGDKVRKQFKKDLISQLEKMLPEGGPQSVREPTREFGDEFELLTEEEQEELGDLVDKIYGNLSGAIATKGKGLAKDALAELRRLTKKAKKLSERRKKKRLNRALEEDGVVDLIGASIDDLQDVAIRAQILRDGRFETLRLFLVDKDGIIVDVINLSSRLPGSAAAWPTPRDEWFKTLKDKMTHLGATQYYIMHNHPVGPPSAGKADTNIIGQYADGVEGFAGSMIIDDRTYAYLEAGKRRHNWTWRKGTVKHLTEMVVPPQPNMKEGYVIHGAHLRGPRDLARLLVEEKIGKDIKPDQMVIFAVDSMDRVRAWLPMRTDVLLDRRNFADRMRGLQRQTGANKIFIFADNITRAPQDYEKVNNLRLFKQRDVIWASAIADTTSPRADAPLWEPTKGVETDHENWRAGLYIGDQAALTDEQRESGEYRPSYPSVREPTREFGEPSEQDVEGTPAFRESDVPGGIIERLYEHIATPAEIEQEVVAAATSTEGTQHFDTLEDVPPIEVPKESFGQKLAKHLPPVLRRGPTGWVNPAKTDIKLRTRRMLRHWGLPKELENKLSDLMNRKGAVARRAVEYSQRLTNIAEQLKQRFPEGQVNGALKLVTQGQPIYDEDGTFLSMGAPGMTLENFAELFDLTMDHPTIKTLKGIQDYHNAMREFIAKHPGLTEELRAEIAGNAYYYTRFYQLHLMGNAFIPNAADFAAAVQFTKEQIKEEIDNVMKRATKLRGKGQRAPLADVAEYFETGDPALLADLSPTRQKNLEGLRNRYLDISRFIDEMVLEEDADEGVYYRAVQNQERLAKAAQGYVNWLLHEFKGHIPAQGGMDISNFQRRMLDPVFRKLYGEVQTAPEVEFATAVVQGNLVAVLMFQESVFEEGEGIWWVSEREQNDEFSVQLGRENDPASKKKYGSLAGKYVNKNLARALDPGTDKHWTRSGIEWFATAAWGMPTAAMRLMKLQGPKTLNRNMFTSVFGFAWRSGDLARKGYRKYFWDCMKPGGIFWDAMKHALAEVKLPLPLVNIPIAPPRWKKNVRGVTEVAKAGEEGWYSADMTTIVQGVTAMLDAPWYRGKNRKFLSPLAAAYALIDFPAKYAAYHNAYDMAKTAGKSDKEAAQLAKDWVLDHYQNRFRTPKAIELYTSIGMADYIGYVYDDIRMDINSIKTAVTSLSKGHPITGKKDPIPMIGYVTRWFTPLGPLGGGQGLWLGGPFRLLRWPWRWAAGKWLWYKGVGDFVTEFFDWLLEGDDDDKDEEKKRVKTEVLEPDQSGAFRRLKPWYDKDATSLDWVEIRKDGSKAYRYTVFAGTTVSPIHEILVGAMQTAAQTGDPWYESVLKTFARQGYEMLGPGMNLQAVTEMMTGFDMTYGGTRESLASVAARTYHGGPPPQMKETIGRRLWLYASEFFPGSAGDVTDRGVRLALQRARKQEPQFGSYLRDKTWGEIIVNYMRLVRTYTYEKEDLAMALKYATMPQLLNLQGAKSMVASPVKTRQKLGTPSESDFAKQLAGYELLDKHRRNVSDIVRDVRTLTGDMFSDAELVDILMDAAGGQKANISRAEAYAMVTGQIDKLPKWESEARPTRRAKGDAFIIKYFETHRGRVNYVELQREMQELGMQPPEDINKFRTWVGSVRENWRKVQREFGD